MSSWEGTLTPADEVPPAEPIAPISDTETKFRVLYWNIELQTLLEYQTSQHTDADILYPSFVVYYNDAVDELPGLLTSRGITLNENLTITAYCHLIADYYEMGNPDWNYQSQTMSPGVSFSRPEDTAPRAALKKMLDQVEEALKRGVGTRMTQDIKETRDSTLYPDRWKLTDQPLPNFITGDYTGQWG